VCTPLAPAPQALGHARRLCGRRRRMREVRHKACFSPSIVQAAWPKLTNLFGRGHASGWQAHDRVRQPARDGQLRGTVRARIARGCSKQQGGPPHKGVCLFCIHSSGWHGLRCRAAGGACDPPTGPHCRAETQASLTKQARSCFGIPSGYVCEAQPVRLEQRR